MEAGGHSSHDLVDTDRSVPRSPDGAASESERRAHAHAARGRRSPMLVNLPHTLQHGAL